MIIRTKFSKGDMVYCFMGNKLTTARVKEVRYNSKKTKGIAYLLDLGSCDVVKKQHHTYANKDEVRKEWLKRIEKKLKKLEE